MSIPKSSHQDNLNPEDPSLNPTDPGQESTSDGVPDGPGRLNEQGTGTIRVIN